MAMHPAEEIGAILKASGLADYCDTNRAYALLAADSLREAQYTLRMGIREYLKNRGHGGSAGSMSYRVARPLKRAADYHEAAAKQFGLVMRYYNGIMIPQNTPVGGKQFDPNA